MAPARRTTAAIGLLVFAGLVAASPAVESFLDNLDHGYQLALGREVLTGAFPFVDLVFHYGPAVAFTSALATRLTSSLLGEVVLCAAGYAATLALIHAMVRRWAGGLAAWSALAAGILLLARFYKWYYWLFPTAVLYCLHRDADAPETSPRWTAAAGTLAGIGALYRLDFAPLFLVTFAALAAADQWNGRAGARWLWAFAAFAATFSPWLAALTWVGGPGAIRDYVNASLVGASGAVRYWSLPLPAFDWRHPATLAAGHRYAMVLFPATYALCLLAGLARRGIDRDGERSIDRNREHPMDRDGERSIDRDGERWMDRGRDRPMDGGRARVMTATGVIGLGLLPQALHRADVPHLLQVLPPMLLAVPLLVRHASDGIDPPRRGSARAVDAALVLYVAAVVVTAILLAPLARTDLVRPRLNPFAQLAAIHRGIPAGSSHPVAQAAAVVRAETTPDARILAVPLACQLVYFAERRLSGLLVAYARGLYDDDEWRKRNLDDLLRHPPALVVAAEPLTSMPPDHPFRVSQPELYDFLRSHYAHVIHESSGWTVLAPSE